MPGGSPESPSLVSRIAASGLRAAVYKKVLQLVAEEIDLAAQSGKPGSEPWESPCRSELAGLKDRLSERLRSCDAGGRRPPGEGLAWQFR